ncbi:MAG: hypothetical protein WC133_00445 [Candidatus Omnitrophota bacterium]
MNLQEFVKDVLVSLDKGVNEARTEMSRDIHFTYSQDQRTVEFDIAVSVEETNLQSGKAGIRVLQFAEGGGELGKENKNASISRIRFGVNIDILTKQESNRRH